MVFGGMGKSVRESKNAKSVHKGSLQFCNGEMK